VTSNGYERAVWRSASAISALIAIVALALGSLLRGWEGFWGALLGATIVVGFLVIHLLVSVVTKSMDPISTMAMAMFAYFAKVLALGGFLIAFRNAEFLDRIVFGTTAICVTIGWLTGEIRTFISSRFVLMEGYTGAKEDHDGHTS